MGATNASHAHWLEFLDSLAREPLGFEKAQIKAAMAAWESIKQSFTVPVPFPLTQPTSEGNIQLAWDAGRFYLELEVRPDGQFEWFYRNRDTNELGGTDKCPDSELSPTFLARLATMLT